MDNGTGQWRSWEHDGNFQKEFHHGGGGFPPHMGPGKMHGNFYNGAAGANNFMMQPGFNDRMMRNGPPHMQPNANQQQPWMDNKYGGGNRFQAYGAPPQAAPMNMVPPSMVGQRGAFMAPPPLGAAHPPHPGMQPPPMHQMPPNPHMNAPAPAPGHQQGGNQFSVGTFSTANLGGMGNMGSFQPNAPAAPPVNDDSVWHDPNGDLRKWQRDTGTAAWGDPTKQSGQPIRRWQQADENDPLGGNGGPNPNVAASVHSNMSQQQSPELKKSIVQDDEEAPETGWGDLPPLNGGAPIPHAPPPGPGPQLGANGAWMMGSGGQQPQPLAAQNSNAPPPAAWADPQRSIASTTNMPPATHGNFYNTNPTPGSGTPTDWSRANFGFNGGNAPHQMINTFESAPNGGGSGTPQGGPIVPGQDPVAGSTNEIADKLRMAATKGWIDPAVFCSNNKLSTQTASLLNTLINRLTAFEQNNNKIEQLKRQEASGAANANGSPQRAELDRLIRETQQMSNELAELREKIHMSVEGQRANKGMSLADELTNMNTMQIGDVGPLW